MAQSDKQTNSRAPHATYCLAVGTRLNQACPATESLTSAQLLKLLETSRDRGPRQKKQGLWVSGQLLASGGRRAPNQTAQRVEEIGTLVLEVDGAAVPSLEQWQELFGYESIGYTTWSHGVKPGLRARALLPMRRAVSPAEAQHLLYWLTKQAQERSGLADVVAPESRDSYRIWFGPRRNPEAPAPPTIRQHIGPVLDPDQVLGSLAQDAALQKGQRELLSGPARGAVEGSDMGQVTESVTGVLERKASVRRRPPVGARRDRGTAQGREQVQKRIEGRALKALREHCDQIAASSQGTRTTNLYKGAARAGELVAAGALEESLAWQWLQSAASSCGLEVEEATRQVRRGLEKGFQNPDHWSPLGTSKKAERGDEKTRPLPPQNAAPAGGYEEVLRGVRDRMKTDVEGVLSGGRKVFLNAAVGAGKTHMKVSLYRVLAGQKRGEVHILVEKDRRSAVKTWEEVGGGAVLLLGRQGKEHTGRGGYQFGKDLLGDYHSCGNGAVLEMSRRGVSAGESCHKECKLRSLCAPKDAHSHGAQLGTLGQWERAKEALVRGGIVVCTSHWLEALLEHHQELKEGRKARLRSVYMDDLSEPGPQPITQQMLGELLERRDLVPTLKQTLSSLSHVLLEHQLEHAHHRNLQEQQGEEATRYATHTRGDVRQRLGHVSLANLKALLGQAGIPGVFGELLEALEAAQQDRGLVIKASTTGAQLDVWPRAWAIPSDCALVVASATGVKEVWEAFCGHELELIQGQLQPQRVTALQTPSYSSTWDAHRLGDLSRMVAEVKHLGQCLAPTVQRAIELYTSQGTAQNNRPFKLLLVTQKALLDSQHWAQLQHHLTSTWAPRHQLQIHAIHWRGIQQVGSNDYQRHDAIITLGDPLMNLGAHRDLIFASSCITKTHQLSDDTYRREAQAWIEQAHGRLRWALADRDTLHIHIGKLSCPMLNATTEPIHLPRIKRHAHSVEQALHFAANLPGGAISTALHHLPGAPCKATLQRAFELDPRPVFQLPHPHSTLWTWSFKADSMTHALETARHLNQLLPQRQHLPSTQPDPLPQTHPCDASTHTPKGLPGGGGLPRLRHPPDVDLAPSAQVALEPVTDGHKVGSDNGL